MSKHLFLLLCIFVCSGTIQAQEFYKSQKSSRFFTKAELDKAIQNINAKSKDPHSITNVSYSVLKTIKRNDSVIHIIKYDFDRKASRIEKVYQYEKQLFPDFKLKNLAGKKVTAEDLQGKITFINVWFINCVPCRREMPLLNILHKKYKDKVDFKSITFDTKEKVQSFLETNTYTFDHLVNAGSFLKKDLGIKLYPKIIIVDRKGIVHYVGTGIPPTFDEKTNKVKDFTEKDLAYLETILKELLVKID